MWPQDWPLETCKESKRLDTSVGYSFQTNPKRQGVEQSVPFVGCKRGIFLLPVIPEFEKANVFLRSGAPQVHLLREVLSNPLRELMLRFVKPSVIRRTDVLTDVCYRSSASQRDDEDLVIRSETTQSLQSLKKEAREEFLHESEASS